MGVTHSGAFSTLGLMFVSYRDSLCMSFRRQTVLSRCLSIEMVFMMKSSYEIQQNSRHFLIMDISYLIKNIFTLYFYWFVIL